MLTQLINGKILTPQGWLKDGSVLISDGKILEVTNCDLAVVGATLIDAKGMYIVPGGVEIHAHGGGGRRYRGCVPCRSSHTHEIWNYQYFPHTFFFHDAHDSGGSGHYGEVDG